MTRIEQKEAKKMKIIQAALDLFVERGYYGTKTSQISPKSPIRSITVLETFVLLRKSSFDKNGPSFAASITASAAFSPSPSILLSDGHIAD